MTASAAVSLADGIATMQVNGVPGTAPAPAEGQIAVPGTFEPALERAVGETRTSGGAVTGAREPTAARLTLGQMLARLGGGARLPGSGGLPAPGLGGIPTPAMSTATHQALGPTVRPLPGPVGSTYGPRVHPVHGDVRFHHGVDIGAPTGTPIQAFARGTVSFAGWRNGYGNIVIIDHADGMSTRYAHQDRIDVAVGQVVAAGDVVGTVGATGTATGPHLHFEVRRNGASVDPTPWLPG
jgi:murein DD-endopeptidase MepM/ murein hydrolase activator NlpD